MTELGTPLNTDPGAVTRLTVNIGPRTAEALNAVMAEHDVTLTEALRVLAAAGYAALRAEAAPSTQDETSRAVDVYGYSGEFLYAGHLQPRGSGGWNVFHHTDSRHQCPGVSVSSVEGDR